MRIRHTRNLGLIGFAATCVAAASGCAVDQEDVVVKPSSGDLSTESYNGQGGGGGNWGGGGSSWGGGGSMWGGGGSWWGGGGGAWAGGGGAWGGGGGSWSGGGGYWGGGGGLWGGGGNWWGGGGGTWAGGGGWWAGGGNWWGGGGGMWSGGGGAWGGGGGMWTGGFATTFPFVGWDNSRNPSFNGIPYWSLPYGQTGAAMYNAASPPTISDATKDTTACAAGTARLGGFAYPIDVEGWPGYVALGFNQKLCLPTPAGAGLTMNPAVATSSLTPTSLTSLGGYAMATDTSNAAKDANMIRTMVGFGAGNVATQYGGALCASIGTLAAAKRNCGVGIAFADPNHERDGVTLTPRGTVLSKAMNVAGGGSLTSNTPFGRNDGYGLYGVAANDMESYANHALQKYTSTAANKLPALPTSATGIDAWNNGTWSNGAPNSYTFTGGLNSSTNASDFAPLALSASPATNTTLLANPATLTANINRSVTSPLNLAPVNGVTSTYTSGYGLSADMNNGLTTSSGDLYLLNLASLSTMQSPLYGSGAGRWFFKSPASATAPVMDIASIYQGSSYVLTGRLSGLPSTNPTLSQANISSLGLSYADWNGDSASGTLYVDSAGQYPSTIASDNDRAARLNAALILKEPAQNLAGAGGLFCAIISAGGGVQCWGTNSAGQLGDGTQVSKSSPTQVLGLTSGVTAVAASRQHACALTSAGAVKCWGTAGAGLGDGTTNPSTTPVQVAGLTSGIVAVASGDNHMCAITNLGGVKCWGQNQSGQVGNGTYNDAATPVDVTGLTSGVVALGLGGGHSCAAKATGEILCWGDNVNGQLGIGTAGNNSNVPVAVSWTSGRPAEGIVSLVGGSISAGTNIGGHTCALTNKGNVWCWGMNDVGQLGDGTTIQRNNPVQITSLTGVVQISAHERQTAAVTKAGAAYAWGNNGWGQLDSSLTAKSTPFAIPSLTSGVVNVVAANQSLCARLVDGTISCWGANLHGQVGNGATLTPNKPGSLTTSAGTWTFGGPSEWGNDVLLNGTVTGSGSQLLVFGGTPYMTNRWGWYSWNGSGWVGTTDPRPTGPILSPGASVAGATGPSTAGNLSVNVHHACAVTSSGTVQCWGNTSRFENEYSWWSRYAMLGDPTAFEGHSEPVTVAGLTGVTAVANGYYHTCALTSAGAVKCWGNETNYTGNPIAYGGLGDNCAYCNSAAGSLNYAQGTTTPQQATGLTSGVTAITAGFLHTCALTSAGAVKCWGHNGADSVDSPGQVGDSTSVDKAVPTQVTNMTSGVTSISAGRSHTCAVKSGAVYCWGNNAANQLGQASTTSYALTAMQVSGISGASQVTSGSRHTCALIAGAVKCWGTNDYGQLGNNSNVTSSSPVQVSGLTSGVTSIAASGNHTCALLSTGTIKCWGQNSGEWGEWVGNVDVTGALGNGTANDAWTPTAVVGITNAASVAVGPANVCARLTTGAVTCWGGNSDSIPGNASPSVSTPVSLGGAYTNGAPIASQGSVLVHLNNTSGQVAGHITPIPWSMSSTSSGHVSAMVAYDPLAAAAAMFIEQYDAHVNACKATCGGTGTSCTSGPGETMTPTQQVQGQYLWACSNATGRTNFLSGMQTLLNGARHYLFGSDTGCIQSTQTVGGAACTATTFSTSTFLDTSGTGDPVHLPYTVVVPGYTSLDNGTYTLSTGTQTSSYYAAVQDAVGQYVIRQVGSSASRLEKTLQLAGTRQFTAGSDALVTSQLVRSMAHTGSGVSSTPDLTCMASDGFGTYLQ